MATRLVNIWRRLSRCISHSRGISSSPMASPLSPVADGPATTQLGYVLASFLPSGRTIYPIARTLVLSRCLPTIFPFQGSCNGCLMTFSVAITVGDWRRRPGDIGSCSTTFPFRWLSRSSEFVSMVLQTRRPNSAPSQRTFSNGSIRHCESPRGRSFNQLPIH